MEETKYNGYANWETWNVALWLNNEEGAQEHARMCGDARALQEWADDMAEEFGLFSAGFYSDLLQSALERVDWQEVWEAVKAE